MQRLGQAKLPYPSITTLKPLPKRCLPIWLVGCSALIHQTLHHIQQSAKPLQKPRSLGNNNGALQLRIRINGTDGSYLDID